jgi:hypothetical protein
MVRIRGAFIFNAASAASFTPKVGAAITRGLQERIPAMTFGYHSHRAIYLIQRTSKATIQTIEYAKHYFDD